MGVGRSVLYRVRKEETGGEGPERRYLIIDCLYFRNSVSDWNRNGSGNGRETDAGIAVVSIYFRSEARCAIGIETAMETAEKETEAGGLLFVFETR